LCKWLKISVVNLIRLRFCPFFGVFAPFALHIWNNKAFFALLYVFGAKFSPYVYNNVRAMILVPQKIIEKWVLKINKLQKKCKFLKTFL
jgi:hypothetical protein